MFNPEKCQIGVHGVIVAFLVVEVVLKVDPENVYLDPVDGAISMNESLVDRLTNVCYWYTYALFHINLTQRIKSIE